MEISLTSERHRQRGDAALSITGEAQVAENGVEFAQVVGMEIDREPRWTGERISAETASGLNLAGGSVQIEFAQIDGSVALGVGGIYRARSGRFSHYAQCGR